MKKILLIATVAVGLSGVSAFAQGNFIFGTGAGYVWNSSLNTRGGSFNVGFAFNAANTGTPAVESSLGMLSTATNSSASAAFNTSSAWSAILNDPNFTVAVNNTSGQAVVGTLSATGGVVYNLAGNFLVTGTSSAGGAAKVYMFAWDNAYATPALAGAAGALVGWSQPFTYNYAANPGAASGNFSAAAVTAGVGAQFGVAVPEPATFALAGLGMAAMLIARRRK